MFYAVKKETIIFSALFLILVASGLGVYYYLARDQVPVRERSDHLVTRGEEVAVSGSEGAGKEPVGSREAAEEETRNGKDVPEPEAVAVLADDAGDAGWTGSPSVWAGCRYDRERLRSQTLAYLQTLLEQASSEERSSLEATVEAMIQRIRKEDEAEMLLRARGYVNTLVSVGQDYAEVVVARVLERSEAAEIGELVARVAGVPLERVTISDRLQQ